MTGKRLYALVGFILLIGCMVGIGVLIFGFGPSNDSFTHEPEESFREWQAKDYIGVNPVRFGEKSVNNKIELTEVTTKTLASTTTSSPGKIKPTLPPVPKLVKAIPTKETKVPTEEPIVSITPDPVKKWASTDDPLTTVNTPLNIPKLQNRGMAVPTADIAPMLPAVPTNPVIYTDQGENESYEENLESHDPEMPGNENIYEDDIYIPDEVNSPMLDLGELIGLATNLYTSGTNSTGMHNFLKVINETLNQGNTSGILAQLNELYSRPEMTMALGPGDSFVGRNSYETSLTAFVFMSFGVFLLNQIHSLINKENEHDGHEESRQFKTNFLEDSLLNVLFEPPLNESALKNNETATGRSMSNNDYSEDSTNSVLSPNYVNNMFRGFLNLVNAYTKNSQALECIWSLYCKELDQTSSKEGLYGLAARINSIGLRLIMNQIPTELTLDVMLRSLLGWDGLPCKKMFSKCDMEKGIAALKAAGSKNNHSI